MSKARELADSYTDGEVVARADILGTVSESAGVPTGAIIERGSNANGEYTKYADGTVVFYRTIPANLGYPATHGYPCAFTSKPYIQATNDSGVASYTAVVNVGPANFSFFSSDGDNTVNFFGMGRWY